MVGGPLIHVEPQHVLESWRKKVAVKSAIAPSGRSVLLNKVAARSGSAGGRSSEKTGHVGTYSLASVPKDRSHSLQPHHHSFEQSPSLLVAVVPTHSRCH